MSLFFFNFLIKINFIIVNFFRSYGIINFLVPSYYVSVQKKYWNVGFFKYWQLRKIPFFIMAFPTIILVLYGNFKIILSIKHSKK